jgi:hypothetical protein
MRGKSSNASPLKCRGFFYASKISAILNPPPAYLIIDELMYFLAFR